MTQVLIRTADGMEVPVGEIVYNYYDMEVGCIATEPDDVGWFYFTPQYAGKGGRTLLNGERICSLAHAKRMGWLR